MWLMLMVFVLVRDWIEKVAVRSTLIVGNENKGCERGFGGKMNGVLYNFNYK
jgi:hypothetical protein